MTDEPIPTEAKFKANQKAYFEDWLDVVEVLSSLQQTRQVAYNHMLRLPSLRPWYESLEALYVKACTDAGVKPAPVFDHDAYVAQKIAQGDAEFTTAYGTPLSPAFDAGVKAFELGEPIGNCPRVADSSVAPDWRSGWLRAQADAAKKKRKA